MRGFRFRSSLKKWPAPARTCRPAADEAPRHTREKTSGTQGRTDKVILAFGQS